MVPGSSRPRMPRGIGGERDFEPSNRQLFQPTIIIIEGRTVLGKRPDRIVRTEQRKNIAGYAPCTGIAPDKLRDAGLDTDNEALPGLAADITDRIPARYPDLSLRKAMSTNAIPRVQ